MENITITRTPPPMRSIRQAIQEIREQDPYTAITEKALRRMVLTGTIPSVRVGCRYLINMNVLYSYLYKGTQAAAENPQSLGQIRKVKE